SLLQRHKCQLIETALFLFDLFTTDKLHGDLLFRAWTNKDKVEIILLALRRWSVTFHKNWTHWAAEFQLVLLDERIRCLGRWQFEISNPCVHAYIRPRMKRHILRTIHSAVALSTLRVVPRDMN